MILPVIGKAYYINLYFSVIKHLKLSADKNVVFRFYDLFSRALYSWLPNNINHTLKLQGYHLAPKYPLINTFESPSTMLDLPKTLVMARFLKKLLGQHTQEERDRVEVQSKDTVDAQTYIFDLLEAAIRKNKEGTTREYLDYIRAFVPLDSKKEIKLVVNVIKFVAKERTRPQIPQPSQAPLFGNVSVDMMIELFRWCDRDTIYSCSCACKYFFAFLHNNLFFFWRAYHTTSPMLLKAYEPFLKYFGSSLPQNLLI